MSDKKEKRDVEGKFVAGVSGNPTGRPKGSKNRLTLLKQSLEVQLREQAAPDLSAVLTKAVELAVEGDRQMIKLLLELHMSKGATDDREVTDKVSITIGTHEPIKHVTIEGNTDETDTDADSGVPECEEQLGDSLSRELSSEASEARPSGKQ